jgi:hypothetical protein
MIVLGDTLTRGERRLVAMGKAEGVLQVRHDFQLVMRDELVGAVEGLARTQGGRLHEPEPHRPGLGG